MHRAIVAVGLVAALAVAPAAFARHGSAKQTSVQALAGGVLVELNAIRTAHGLVPLKLNPVLTAAAKGHNSEMLTRGYFAHNSLSGAPFWKRLNSYSNKAAHGYWSVGENLLWESPDVQPAEALRLWMASPEHRKNILTANWREIGISAIHADTAPGPFAGQAVTVITTDFGVRR